MHEPGLRIGRVVKSRAGRDKGRHFMVCQVIDSSFVLLADGDLRTMDKPKRKKAKHLDATQVTLDQLAGKIQAGGRVEDYEIRAALAQAGFPKATPREEGR